MRPTSHQFGQQKTSLSLHPARLFVLLLLACLAVSGNVSAEDVATHPSELKYPELGFELPRAHREELPNGMVLFLMPDHSVPIVKARALLRTGAIYETPEQAGLASFTNKVLRLGGSAIASSTDLNRQLEYVGAALEANADYDWVTLTLSCLSRDVEMGFDHLAALLLRPSFETMRIEQHRREVLETLRRTEDDPIMLSRREFRRLLYGDHPYGRDQSGLPETVSGFQQADLAAWHQEWYRPDRVIFSIAGDMDLEAMRELVRKHFGDWSAPSDPCPTAQVVHARPEEETRTFLYQRDLNQATIRIGQLGPTIADEDLLALRMFNYILGGGGFSSRLFSEVRGKHGYAYSVGSALEAPLQPGQFLAIMQTQIKNATNAATLTKQIIREMLEPESITQTELDRAKDSLLNEFVFKFETAHEIVTLYAHLELYDLPDDYWDTYCDSVQALTLEQIRAAALRHLHPEKWLTLYVGHPDLAEELQKIGAFAKIPTQSE